MYERNPQHVDAPAVKDDATDGLNPKQQEVVKIFSLMLGHQKGEYVTFGDLEALLIKLCADES